MTASREKDAAAGKPKYNQTLAMNKGDGNEVVDTSCGYCCCKPVCMQRCCNTPRGVGIAVTIYTAEYSIIVLGCVNAMLVTISRRYGFSNAQVAWIPATQDIIGAITAITVGYLGTFWNKGRLLAFSALAQCVASLVFLLTHFLTPLYELGAAPIETCDPTREIECNEVNSGNELFFWLMVLAQAFHGVSGGVLWCIAVPYMDENMKAKNTPLYIGYMYAGSAFGALLGYVFGGAILQVYVDIGRVDLDDIVIEPGDPRWVGAWWIPFVVGAIGGLLCAMYIGAYPRYVPDAARYQAERKSEAHKGTGNAPVSTEGNPLKNFWKSTKVIITNPTWIFLTIAGIFSSGIVVGFTVFLPAVLTFQFDQNPGEAAVIAGLVIVPAAIGGYLLGGIIPKKFNFKLKSLMKQTLICTVVVAIFTPVLLLRCEVPPIAGINRAIYNSFYEIEEVNLTVPCNEPCGCDTRAYDPLCDDFGVQHFSPCHAACLDRGKDEDDNDVFYNCGCIPPSNGTNYDAVSGACDGDCIYFFIFLGAFFIPVTLIFMASTSGVSATIRAVPETERSYATGLQSTIVRFLGNVPFPILMGSIFDQSCLVWQYTCDERGSCWVYDTVAMSIGLTVMACSALLISSICHVCAISLYKPPPEGSAEILMDVNVGSGVGGKKPFEDNYIPSKAAYDITDVCYTNNSYMADGGELMTKL